jgi:hypothetical protein
MFQRIMDDPPAFTTNIEDDAQVNLLFPSHTLLSPTVPYCPFLYSFCPLLSTLSRPALLIPMHAQTLIKGLLHKNPKKRLGSGHVYLALCARLSFPNLRESLSPLYPLLSPRSLPQRTGADSHSHV